MPVINRLRRSSQSATEDPGGDQSAREGLSAWENEGGSSPETEPVHPIPNPLAARLKQGKESATDLALKARRRADRARVAIELRRLSSRLTSEIDGLGHDLFPLLKNESLQVDLPAVRQRMDSIAALQREIDRKRARSEALSQMGDREDAKRSSMANIDANATEEATANQTAKDAAAEAWGQPAEQGGEG